MKFLKSVRFGRDQRSITGELGEENRGGVPLSTGPGRAETGQEWIRHPDKWGRMAGRLGVGGG